MSADSRALLSLRGVSKHFGGVTALSDVNLDGVPDIAIGAPDATVANSGGINTGAVSVLSGSNLPTTS